MIIIKIVIIIRRVENLPSKGIMLSLDTELLADIERFRRYHDLANGYSRSFIFALLLRRGLDSREPIGKKGVGVASHSKEDIEAGEEIKKAIMGEGIGRN